MILCEMMMMMVDYQLARKLTTMMLIEVMKLNVERHHPKLVLNDSMNSNELVVVVVAAVAVEMFSIHAE